MPITLENVNNVRTQANITKYNLDLSKFDTVKDLRNAIRKLQYSERNKKRQTLPISLPSSPSWVSEITKKTMDNVRKYNLNLNDFKTKEEVGKAIQRIKMKEYRLKKKETKKVNEEDGVECSFNKQDCQELGLDYNKLKRDVEKEYVKRKQKVPSSIVYED